jgi:hypothetical protein
MGAFGQFEKFVAIFKKMYGKESKSRHFFEKNNCLKY